MDDVKTLSEKLFMNPKNAAAILDESERCRRIQRFFV